MRVLCGPFNADYADRYRAVFPDMQCYADDGKPFEQIWNELPPDWKPDVVVAISPEYRQLPVGIEHCPVPLAFVVGDWNLGFSRIAASLHMADLILTDRKGVETFRAHGFRHVVYWPAFSFNPDWHRVRPDEPIRYDVSFIGSFNHGVHQGRARLLARLAALSDRVRIGILTGVEGDDYGRVLSQSRIIFNRSVRGEMNMRAYEACAAGRLMLIEADNLEVGDFLPDGEACVTYRDEDLEQTILDLLADPDRLERIAAAGHRRIQSETEFDHWRLLEACLAAYPFPRPEERTWWQLTDLERDSARILQGVATLTQHAFPRTLALASRVLASQPTAHRIRNIVSVMLAIVGGMPQGTMAEMRQAEALLADCAAQDGDFAVALSNLAHLQVQLGRPADALATFERALGALDRRPQVPTSDLLFPFRYDRLRVEWEACAAAGDSLRAGRLLRAACLRTMAALVIQDEPQRAVTWLESATQTDPDDPEGWALLGNARHALGAGDVVAPWQRSLALQPIQFDLRLQLVRHLLGSGRLKDASNELAVGEAQLNCMPAYQTEWQAQVVNLRSRAEDRYQHWVIKPDWADGRWQQVLGGFLAAFRGEEPVVLHVLAAPEEGHDEQRAFHALLGAIKALGYDPDGVPEIAVTDQPYAVPAWAARVRQEADVADWRTWFLAHRAGAGESAAPVVQ